MRRQDKRYDHILVLATFKTVNHGFHGIQTGISYASSNVAHQLEFGGNFSGESTSAGIQCFCVHLVVHGKSIDRHQRKSLNDRKVTFRKKKNEY